MSPDALTLARALAAHPRWRWMPGMRPLHHDDAEGFGYRYVRIPRTAEAEALRGNPWWYPDLDDPATCGCLLAMLDEASNHSVTVCRGHFGWFLVAASQAEREYVALGAVLAKALLACWGPA